MRTVRKLAAVLLAALFLGSFICCSAAPKKKDPRETKKQIVILARRVKGVTVYEHERNEFKGPELNYELGEMRLSATGDSEIIVILEDSMSLSDIKDVPQMALNAGFHNIRAFVYWKGTGNMAEVMYGKVLKFKTQNINY
jgi:hypothetical protein